MTRFQRMMVIPQEEYAHLLSMRRSMQPHTTQYQNLETDYQQQGEIKDPYSRLVHQSETIDQMKLLKSNMHQSLMTATPKPYRNRAETLMKVLEPHITLTAQGEIVNTVSGQVIKETRMDDLIQHAVRDRRRQSFSPRGWRDFVQLLREVNVPKIILNKDTMDDLDRLRRPIKRPNYDVDEKSKLSSKIPRMMSKRKRIRSRRYPEKDFLLNY